MKKNIILFSSLMLGIFLLSTCKPFDLNTEDLELNLDLNIINTMINLEVVDATTGELIGSEDASQVKISIRGKDAQAAVTPLGIRMTEVYSVTGFASIGFDPFQTSPSLEDPIEIFINAELDGYMPTTWPLSIPGQGVFTYEIRMVSKIAPPVGVVISNFTDAGETDGGLVKEDIRLETSTDGTKILIAAGTRIQTEDGKPLEGKLNITIAQFDPLEDNSIASFPGGLSAKILDQDQQQSNGYFVTSGYFSLDISDQNGHKASGIPGNQIELSFNVNPNLINPETNKPIEEGDEISIWGLDEKNGTWTYVGKMKATPDLMIVKSAKIELGGHHFRVLNSGWFQSNSLNQVRASVKISIANMISFGIYPSFNMDCQIRDMNGVLRYLGVFSGAPNFFVPSLWWLVGNVPQGNHKISFLYRGTDICPYILPYPMTHDFKNGEFIYNFNQNPAAQGLVIQFHVTVFCNNLGTTMTIPNGLRLRYRIKDPLIKVWQYNYISQNGYVPFSELEMNKTYYVQVLYEDKWIPEPYYEYTLTPSTDPNPANLFKRSIRFEFNCNY